MSENAAGRLPSGSRIALAGADAGPPSDTHTYYMYIYHFMYTLLIYVVIYINSCLLCYLHTFIHIFVLYYTQIIIHSYYTYVCVPHPSHVGGYGEPLAAGAGEAAGPLTPGPLWYVDMRSLK